MTFQVSILCGKIQFNGNDKIYFIEEENGYFFIMSPGGKPLSCFSSFEDAQKAVKGLIIGAVQEEKEQKYLYELVTKDSTQFIFCIARNDGDAIEIAIEKTKEEANPYKFVYDDIIMKIEASDTNEVGVYEYLFLDKK